MANMKNPWDNENIENPWDNKEPEKIIKFQKIKKTQKPNLNIRPAWWVLIVIALWLATGFYQVQTNENGVVLRFGKYVDTTAPGLHYHLPYPIEDVIKVSMTQEIVCIFNTPNNGKVNIDDIFITGEHMCFGKSIISITMC